jgi:hypothetical protein
LECFVIFYSIPKRAFIFEGRKRPGLFCWFVLSCIFLTSNKKSIWAYYSLCKIESGFARFADIPELD